MAVKNTNRLADGMVRCALCRGDFPRLTNEVVAGCRGCDERRANPSAFAPWHYSSNHCESGGPRQHAGCIGQDPHCTCDRCF